MRPDREQLRELLRVVAATAPQELDCEAFLARVGGLLEALGTDGEIAPELKSVAQHLEICPECREEFEALLRLHPVSPGRDLSWIPGPGS